jgi:glutathione S-transferase
MDVDLYGFTYSVYSWIARLALHEKGVHYKWIEVDPFAENVPADYVAKHPFRRVPALVHGDFTLYETNAITRYVDETFEGPELQRRKSHERGRCNQIISIADSYAYWPMVRQVFSHRVFRPRMGRPADEADVRRGLDAAPGVLGALETLASGGDYLCGSDLSLADIQLAPMIGSFALVSEAATMLRQHDRLSIWWSAMSQRKAFQATMPRLLEPSSRNANTVPK